MIRYIGDPSYGSPLGVSGIAASSLIAGRDFLSLTPAPPPFSGMNSTPAVSSAVRIAAVAFSETARRPRSKSTIVESPSPAVVASLP